MMDFSKEATLLKPCLCGNRGIVSELQGNPKTWDVLCFDPGCAAKTAAMKSKEGAMLAWNRMQEKE